MGYRKSLLYFSVGFLNSLSLYVLKYSDNFVEKLFVSITIIFSYAANLALCWDNFIEEWFIVMDAIIFGCNCTLFMVFISGKDNVSSLEDSSSLTSAFISFFSILLLVMYNFLSGVKAIDADRNTVAFSVSSMGAADFVYNEDGADDDEMKNFIIDHFVEGFRCKLLDINCLT